MLRQYEQARQSAQACRACLLSESRQKVVWGRGPKSADIMLVGEAPGRDEDRTGQPFVGSYGNVLSKVLKIVGIHEARCYITNIVKCRPPNNRDPRKEEKEKCSSLYLKIQIASVKPKIIVPMGTHSTRFIFGDKVEISQVHGWLTKYDVTDMESSWVIPTFHPAVAIDNGNRGLIALVEDFLYIAKVLNTGDTRRVL